MLDVHEVCGSIPHGPTEKESHGMCDSFFGFSAPPKRPRSGCEWVLNGYFTGLFQHRLVSVIVQTHTGNLAVEKDRESRDAVLADGRIEIGETLFQLTL